MKSLDPLRVDSYDYNLPKELIAKEPIKPADMAKLLVYDRKSDKVTHTIFKDLDKFIPKDTSFVFNNTKVIKARIFGRKSSGGKIELLLNRALNDNTFSAFIRGRVNKDTILEFDLDLKAKVLSLCSDGSRVVEFYIKNEKIGFEELLKVLDSIGHVPLPPYINREDKKSDEIDYQPIFAQKAGAVAAPTASLHFTKELLDKIKKEFDVNYLTLHVGAGTFKPIKTKSLKEHIMHSEYYEIPKDTQELIDSKREILAIGTTVTRAIEYYVRAKKSFGECDLFLHPLNHPKRVNYLLTNFHLPKSTLIMLVASFIGIKKTLELYEIAIKNRYRFYSYGDAMLIL